MTHTNALMDISHAAHSEIDNLLRAAGYAHAIEHGVLDMSGISLVANTRARSWLPSLEGMRAALLEPRALARDEDGFLAHPALPLCDEDTRYDLLLLAFKLETAFVGMESDCADEALVKAVHEGASCAAWTPTPPKGEGWVLLEIYPTEDGPYALFAREAKTMPPRRRTTPTGAPRFPTMLRKMWSGGEVQQWIDENWSPRPGPTPAQAEGTS